MADILAFITAIATSLSAMGVLAATLVAARQLHRTQRATAITTMVQLLKDWDDAPTRAVRSRAATKLLANPPVYDRDALDVLNVFETIAFLVVVAEVVGEEEAYTAFCEPVTFWVGACRSFLDEFRATDPAYFENALALERRLLAFDARKRHLTIAAVTPDAQRIHSYLEAESRLPQDPGQPRVISFAPDASVRVRLPTTGP